MSAESSFAPGCIAKVGSRLVPAHRGRCAPPQCATSAPLVPQAFEAEGQVRAARVVRRMRHERLAVWMACTLRPGGPSGSQDSMSIWGLRGQQPRMTRHITKPESCRTVARHTFRKVARCDPGELRSCRAKLPQRRRRDSAKAPPPFSDLALVLVVRQI